MQYCIPARTAVDIRIKGREKRLNSPSPTTVFSLFPFQPSLSPVGDALPSLFITLGAADLIINDATRRGGYKRDRT